jgi:hypothetical protein
MCDGFNIDERWDAEAGRIGIYFNAEWEKILNKEILRK